MVSDKIFKYFLYISLHVCSTCDPQEVATFGPQGHNFIKLVWKLTLYIGVTPKQALSQTVYTQMKCLIMLHFIRVNTVCKGKQDQTLLRTCVAGAHLQCVNSGYAKFKYTGMKSDYICILQCYLQ